jgi:hypothetical protein
MVGVVMAGLSAWILVALVLSLRANAETPATLTVSASPAPFDDVSARGEASTLAAGEAPNVGAVSAPESTESAAGTKPAEPPPPALPPGTATGPADPTRTVARSTRRADPIQTVARSSPTGLARSEHVASPKRAASKPAIRARLVAASAPSPNAPRNYSPPTARFAD